MPWHIRGPFRMRPDLARLESEPALFLRDAQADAYAAHKRQVLRSIPARAPSGTADANVLSAIALLYQEQTGVCLQPDAQALAEGLQEDFVILHDEPDDGQAGRSTMRARFLSVCFPSNWDPSEKLGLDFSAIHAPVADNALLQSGARGIIDMAFRQAPMLRHVWLLTPDGGLAQHPLTRRTRWGDLLASVGNGRLIDRIFYRVERQTTLPLPALQRGVFFIRVLVAPLADVLRVAPGRAAELADALRSMSDAVVAYRGMADVRDRIGDELAILHAED